MDDGCLSSRSTASPTFSNFSSDNVFVLRGQSRQRGALSLSLAPRMICLERQDLGMSDFFAASLGALRGFADTYCRYALLLSLKRLSVALRMIRRGRQRV